MSARERVWIVRVGDGPTLGDVLRSAGESAGAIADGRVFVGKKRALQVDQAVRAGDAVRIGPPSASARPPPIEILFERDGVVACAKPAGIPTVPDHAGGAHALVALVARQIGRRSEDLVVTSRLDRPVSGVVVFALDAEAEARLRAARAAGTYARRYVAIAAGAPAMPAGLWESAIDDKPSATRFSTAAIAGPYALLAVDPVTGRTHQIRIHASRDGAPLVGDAEYGGPARLTLANGTVLAPGRIALHAARVIVPDRRGQPLVALAPIPPELARLWTSLGGDAGAWDRALSISTAGA